MLIIGGDLAYPNPSNEAYEARFFRPYEAAMPAPQHALPGALVVQKPDLPALRERKGGSTCQCPPSNLCAAHADSSTKHGLKCR